MRDAEGWFTFATLYDAVVQDLVSRGVKHPRIAEIGVWKGRSLIYMARLLEKYFPEGWTLYAVDPFPDEAPFVSENAPETFSRKRMKERGETLWDVFSKNLDAQPLPVFRGISVIRQESAMAANIIDGPLDFVFIDACHSEESVRQDIEAWGPKADIMAGHDIRLEAVKAGVDTGLRKLGGGKVAMEHGDGRYYSEVKQVDCWVWNKCTHPEDAYPIYSHGEKIANRIIDSDLRQEAQLGVPTGANAQVDVGTARSILALTEARRLVSFDTMTSSLLTHSFNQLYCNALNARKAGVNRFVMLHSDIQPVPLDWLDRLLDIMDEYAADVISVLMPIKDERGLTSTAMDTDQWRPQRLTIKEAAKLPPTFDARDVHDCVELGVMPGGLLFNTGIMAIRLDQLWSEDVVFDMSNRRIKIPTKDGKQHVFCAEIEPEDWKFSRWCNARGLRTVVTQEIEAIHAGGLRFANRGDWGHETDETNSPEAVKAAGRIECAISD